MEGRTEQSRTVVEPVIQRGTIKYICLARVKKAINNTIRNISSKYVYKHEIRKQEREKERDGLHNIETDITTRLMVI